MYLHVYLINSQYFRIILYNMQYRNEKSPERLYQNKQKWNTVIISSSLAKQYTKHFHEKPVVLL